MFTKWNNDQVSVKESPPRGAGAPQYSDMSQGAGPFYLRMPALVITYKKTELFNRTNEYSGNGRGYYNC